jgi:hypothetical protein
MKRVAHDSIDNLAAGRSVVASMRYSYSVPCSNRSRLSSRDALQCLHSKRRPMMSARSMNRFVWTVNLFALPAHYIPS